MEADEIREFLESCKMVFFFPQKTPFDANEIVFVYPQENHIDWIVGILFFQENYGNTLNVLNIMENNIGAIDIHFQANSMDKIVDIFAENINYDKKSFEIFYAGYKEENNNVVIRFDYLKEEKEMIEVITIDPSREMNQPIHITRLTLTPSGASFGD